MTDFPAIKRILQEVGTHERALGLEDELQTAWTEYERAEALAVELQEVRAREYARWLDRYEGREITGEL